MLWKSLFLVGLFLSSPVFAELDDYGVEESYACDIYQSDRGAKPLQWEIDKDAKLKRAEQQGAVVIVQPRGYTVTYLDYDADVKRVVSAYDLHKTFNRVEEGLTTTGYYFRYMPLVPGKSFTIGYGEKGVGQSYISLDNCLTLEQKRAYYKDDRIGLPEPGKRAHIVPHDGYRYTLSKEPRYENNKGFGEK